MGDLALLQTRRALQALDADGRGSSAAACYLQLALDLLEDQIGYASLEERPLVFELV